MKREALVVARLFTEIYPSTFFFVLGIRCDIPTCRWYLHKLLFGLDVTQKQPRRQVIDVRQHALARVLQTVSGFLTELMILSDWGKVGFWCVGVTIKFWQDQSKVQPVNGTLGGKREVAGNQSSPGRKDCWAQAQVFHANRRRVPLLSAWQWCDLLTKIRSTASNGWHLLHRLGKDWVQKN